MNTTPTEDTIREICDRLHDAATQEHSLQHRISATIVLIERLTGIEAEVLPVRAVLYSRSAVNRLGGAMMPAHAGEIAHFREQVGPAMILLGIDQPHAVLLAADLMIELADSAQWAQRGVLLHPFVANRPTDLTQWTITGLRYGVTATYQHHPDLAVSVAPDFTARRLARDIERAMQPPPHLRHAN